MITIHGVPAVKIAKGDGSAFYVLVDSLDYDEVRVRAWHMAGGKTGGGRYAAWKAPTGETVYLHRLIAQRMGLVGEVAGEGRKVPSVDHINGDKLDNRRENLRLRTRPEQMSNLNDGLRSTNTSGHRGVSYVAGREYNGKPWNAYVTVDYKRVNLGYFATMEEAIAARAAWDADGTRTRLPRRPVRRMVGPSKPRAPESFARGEQRSVLLTDAKVREIRALTAAGVRNKDLAARFGVSPSMVCAVVDRSRWAHVE